MSRKKRFIHLSAVEEQTVRSGLKNHPKPEFRMKCQALLMSHSGLEMKQICQVLQISLTTLCSWFSLWETKGVCGLQRSKGQGRRPILSISNPVHQTALAQAQVQHYQDAKAIQTALIQELKLGMSTDTVKRFLKKIIIPGDGFDGIRKRAKIAGSTKRSDSV